MPTIQVLDQNTINQIAAGEVIERPASVVKELLENAIDAKATAVTVEIKDGGISLIRITDNGCGIKPEEIPLAFLRHSTSKIRSVEDLLTVSSLGFRGEALSSIAAVAQVELITKVPDALNGSRYVIEGGEEKSLEEIGCPEGTTFLVRNLFYNTPARRKFLKTAQTEAGYIAEIVERIALSHPEVSIRFINNNQNKLHTSGNNNQKDIIYQVYGREITANLLPIKSEASFGSIQGFIGKPLISRGNRSFENYYVNGRYIKSSIISKAIEEAYQPYLMQHKYPFAVFDLKINAELLDINVHPTKMELRFRNGQEVFEFVKNAIGQTLAHKELIPEVEISAGKVAVRPLTAYTASREAVNQRMSGQLGRQEVLQAEHQEVSQKMTQPARQETAQPMAGWEAGTVAGREPAQPLRTPTYRAPEPFEVKRAGMVRESVGYTAYPKVPKQEEAEMKAEQIELFESRLLSKEAKPKHQIIGQVFDTYWIVQYQDKMFMIDQHAAHEKVLYERTIKGLEDKEYTSQMMNPPIIVTLDLRQENLLEENKESFEKLGFEIEPFGGREYAISAVPGNLFGLISKEVFLELLDGLSEELKPGVQTMVLEKVASMSCKAAVKGNHRLSEAEARSLIDQLLELDNPYHCPHGRPTIVAMTKSEIEKKFKRIL
ncbi:MAG: DNA mismatch repair endonuclease MutL [Lachnospiraceae bacterium]|nr:DNA mismatch repair endonuclease MutL [Lachnospiraceae bacterium]